MMHNNPPSYSQPPSNYQQPQPNYQQPQPSYPQPQPNYPQPPSNYQQPPPSYSQSPSSFQQPTPSYSEPTSNYTAERNMDVKTDTETIPYNSIDATGDTTFCHGFGRKEIRHNFIKKVYLILCVQLLVTLAMIALFVFERDVQNWVQFHGQWLYIMSYVVFLVTYCTLVCCEKPRRQVPLNYICLAIFTLALSFMTALISRRRATRDVLLRAASTAFFYDTKIVFLAAGISAAVCLSVSIFAIQTKIDFTLCHGLLFAMSMVLFFFGFACLFTYIIWGYNEILNCVYAGLGALVFSLFLIFDTQMIVGGRRHELSEEDYIYGAVQLYVDVVYIFIFMLSIFGKGN